MNELFEEMKKNKGESDGEDRSSDRSEYTDEEELTPKTPDTRELIRHSNVSSVWKDKLSSQISQRSSVRMMMAQRSSHAPSD